MGWAGQGYGDLNTAVGAAYTQVASMTPEARDVELQYWREQRDQVVEVSADIGIYGALVIISALEALEIVYDGGVFDPPDLHFENPDTASEMVGFDFYDLPTVNEDGSLNFDNWNTDWLAGVEGEA
jgi:hypothetical protein